jgi:hypothetical protein
MRSISPEIPSVAGLRSGGAAFMGRSHFAMGSGSRGCRQSAILADGLSNRAEIRHDERTMEIDDRWGMLMRSLLALSLPAASTSAANCRHRQMRLLPPCACATSWRTPASQPCSLDPCGSCKHRAVRSAAGLSRTESRQRRRLPTEE